MKNVLSIREMSEISGGKFWDGFCVAVGIGSYAAPLLAISGVGLAILLVTDVGCIAYHASHL
jgi:hypothetical protein